MWLEAMASAMVCVLLACVAGALVRLEVRRECEADSCEAFRAF